MRSRNRTGLRMLTAALCALLLAACAKEQPVQETAPSAPPVAEQQESLPAPVHEAKYRIGVSLQGLQAPYIERLKDGLNRQQFRYNGEIELIIMDGAEDPDRQNAQIEELIVKKADAIIFNPMSYETGAIGLELAHRSGVPVVLLTTTTSNMELADAVSISDHRESGHIQMDMAAEYLGYRGKIAVLKGPVNISSAFLRTEGYEDRLKQYPGLEVTVSQPANWSMEEAYSIVENWLRLGKDIDAIVAQNDNMAIGALEAVSDAGLEGKIAVFGIDGDMETLQLIREGRMQGTVYHDASGQTAQAVLYALQAIRGQKISSVPVPYQAVTRENVDYYIRILESLNGDYRNR